MGRTVAMRVSYGNDARYISRLKDAAELEDRDPKFRAELCVLLHQLHVLLSKGPNYDAVKKTNAQ